MKSKCFVQRLAALDITKSHRLPYESDDNPYSEARFKTMKYPPEFRDRFAFQPHLNASVAP